MRSFFYYNTTASQSHQEQGEKQTPFFAKERDQAFFGKNASQAPDNFFPSNPVQTKSASDGLTIGQPGDKYEVEADAMADAVVHGSKSARLNIQQKPISRIQKESLATPLEDEKLGTAEERMAEDKLVQEKHEGTLGGDIAVQRKCAECLSAETSVEVGGGEKKVKKKEVKEEESPKVMTKSISTEANTSGWKANYKVQKGVVVFYRKGPNLLWRVLSELALAG